jgi:hypothetical protein
MFLILLLQNELQYLRVRAKRHEIMVAYGTFMSGHAFAPFKFCAYDSHIFIIPQTNNLS